MNLADRFFAWLDRNDECIAPMRARDPKPECMHYNTRVFGHSMLGYGYCQDCHQEVGLEVVFDNLIRRANEAHSLRR